MTTEHRCSSCTMPIESGTLCEHCSDDQGDLRPFEELFERMVQWTLKNHAGRDARRGGEGDARLHGPAALVA